MTGQKDTVVRKRRALIAVAGASSVACLTLAHRLGKGDDDEKSIA